MTPDPDRAGYIAGMRRLTDVLEQHPEVDLPYTGRESPGTIGFHGADGAERLIAAVRAFQCAWTTDIGERWVNLDAQLDGFRVRLYASRDSTCVRVVADIEERAGKRFEITRWDVGPDLAAALRAARQDGAS